MRNPPPQLALTIKEWNAGDNQWPPRPHMVDLDVTIAAGVALKEPVEVSYQYEAKGRVTAPKTIVRSSIDLAPGAFQVLHGSINVKHNLESKADRRQGRAAPPLTRGHSRSCLPRYAGGCFCSAIRFREWRMKVRPAWEKCYWERRCHCSCRVRTQPRSRILQLASPSLPIIMTTCAQAGIPMKPY
jgi:hypothetical protein